MSKRIAFFIGGMHGGGAERVISILANHYAQKMWNVDMVLLLSNKVEYVLDSRIRVINLVQTEGSYYRRLPKWLKNIRKYVKNNKPDRIVSFIGRINVLVLTACLGLKTPIIVSERNDPKHDGRGSLMLNYCNWIYKYAKTVVYQTKYEQSCFSKNLNNGRIIANPVHVSVPPIPLQRPFEIVTAGRLQPQKNQAVLISAVSKLSKQFPDVQLRIYGDGSLKEQLAAQIKELNCEGIIHLCGNVSNLHEKINGAGIFALCSEFEGLSNALIEAMMLGLVCISTDYPGADELIHDGENGLITKRNNELELINTIKTVLLDDDMKKKLSYNAIELSKKYCEEVVIKQWEKTIEN